MGQGMNLTVNRLPARTWNWLRMNESHLNEIQAAGRNDFALDLPDEISYHRTGENQLGTLATGMGPDLDRLAEESGVETDLFEVPAQTRAARPVCLRFQYPDGAAQLNRVDIRAGAGSESVFLLELDAQPESGGLAAVQVRVLAEEGAQVRVLQVQRLGAGFTHLADLGGACAAGASLQTLQLELGGGAVYAGCEADLNGQGSALEADVGYLGRGEQQLDFNYVARHRGRKTQSQMTVSGVLRDRARKLFRGSIDFVRGAAGSVGDEREDVLLLGEDVVNQTIPLILCGEEDVQGNHGATIGRLDEDLLFYLTSRGIPQEQVEAMLARSRIEALCRKLPDQEAVARVEAFLDQAVSGA